MDRTLSTFFYYRTCLCSARKAVAQSVALPAFLIIAAANVAAPALAVPSATTPVTSEIAPKTTPAFAIELSPDVPPLPDARETDRPLYISARNASLFHDLLLAPIAQWFKEGKFVARVVRSHPVSFKLSATVAEQSRKNGEQNALVDGVPLHLPAPENLALPFGLADNISREPDARKRAQMILWNATFMQFLSRQTLYSFDFGWLGAQARQRTAQGFLFSELYPQLQGGAPAGTQAPSSADLQELFRADLLQFTAPAVVAGYVQLTHRLLTSAKDRIWISSPVIGKSREVVDPNRGDPILGSLLSFDDLLGLSTNLRSLEVSVLEERTLLVPFPTVEPTKLIPEPWLPPGQKSPTEGEAGENVLTARGPFRNKAGGSAFATWNADTAEHPQGAGWIPTSSVFIPRKVWVLEISKNDPYYLLGREILVVDQELQLPVYKVIYDRKGIYLRTLVAAWTIAADEAGMTRVPVLGYLLAADRRLSAAAVFTTNTFQTFGSRSDSKALGSLRQLLNIHAHQEAPSQEPKATEPVPPNEAAKPNGPAKPEEVEEPPVD